MPLRTASLNSGSNGNCYYIGNREEAVLIDAGLSNRETERRMRRLELSIKKVKAIFITHEHADHIAGVASITKKHGIPVYITPGTLEQSQLRLSDHLVRTFATGVPVEVGNLSVVPVAAVHDAIEPHNFLVRDAETCIGVFTDIGNATPEFIRHFRQCHAAFLESNYDVKMLEDGTYASALKQRIRGGKGHLSNLEALQVFLEHRPSFMTHLFLAHLSWNNNEPGIVRDLFSRVAGHTEIIIASRHRETPVYQIGAGDPRRSDRTEQLSLFGG